MKNFRALLAAAAALTLVFSIVSAANPGVFSSVNAFADEHDDPDDEKERPDANHRNDKGEKQRRHEEHAHEKRSFFKVELETGDHGVEIEVELKGLNMTGGEYDIAFSCEEPAFNVTFADAFEVKDSEGKFKEEIGLANGTYTGCELAIAGTDMIIASFDAFAVQEGHEEEHEERIEEKRKERIREIVAKAKDIARANAAHAGLGQHGQGLSYILMANGTAENRHGANSTDATSNVTVAQEADAELVFELAVWKSIRPLVLLNILGGTVEVEEKIYSIALGHAIYSKNHDILRISALVTDESGNILKLRLRGSAAANASLPVEPGQSLDLIFEGSGGPSHNRLSSSHELSFGGTLAAQDEGAETFAGLVQRLTKQGEEGQAKGASAEDDPEEQGNAEESNESQESTEAS